MIVLEKNEAILQSYSYKALEPDEYDETKEQIVSFIEEQSKAYRQTLESTIKQHKITYRPEYLDRTIGTLQRPTGRGHPMQRTAPSVHPCGDYCFDVKGGL